MVNNFIKKCITIPIEQEKFLNDKEQDDFKLSKFLQEKLWDYMKKRDEMKCFINSCSDKEMDIKYG